MDGSKALRIDLDSLAQTDGLGGRLAGLLRPGDVVGLVGELGVGKTTLVQAVARALGVAFGVTSPSFTFHRVHEGRIRLHHVDLFRAETEDDVASLGLDEILGRDGATLVEWFDRLAPGSVPDVLVLAMTLRDDQSRLVEATADGPRSREILATLSTNADEGNPR